MNTKLVPEPIRELLDIALKKDPVARATAEQIKREAERLLSAFLRKTSAVGRFSPLDELQQLRKFLPAANVLHLMPITERHNLTTHLQSLRTAYGFTSEQIEDIDRLIKRIA